MLAMFLGSSPWVWLGKNSWFCLVLACFVFVLFGLVSILVSGFSIGEKAYVECTSFQTCLTVRHGCFRRRLHDLIYFWLGLLIVDGSVCKDFVLRCHCHQKHVSIRLTCPIFCGLLGQASCSSFYLFGKTSWTSIRHFSTSLIGQSVSFVSFAHISLGRL